ncbi:MAG: ImmA/IrrE family metallo-endopeptidase [Anaerovoracaceae bacterium]|nr:ImmA/IrrE family metallo-endopeptidase [Bacillota bacterium]MDD7733877.1 ImmA/IrrE family metallo-endopeptidase [Bacillota bacterium]MDY5905871.1 ImmA/IrrE family metallo-endopeptidase [Anaerovoracaceae bacterium]
MKNEITKAVQNLVSEYGTNDPFELADALGILIMPSKAIKGCTMNLLGYPVIFLGEDLNDFERRYVCAHELAHNVLHDIKQYDLLIHSTFFDEDKVEVEADTFAAELLISDDVSIKYPGFTLEQVAASENVPLELVKLKFGLS